MEVMVILSCYKSVESSLYYIMMMDPIKYSTVGFVEIDTHDNHALGGIRTRDRCAGNDTD